MYLVRKINQTNPLMVVVTELADEKKHLNGTDEEVTAPLGALYK
jgi:hypothetical protein